MTRRAVAVAAAAALLFGAHAAGAPTWRSPVQISSGDRAFGPELAVNAAGDALVVWDQEVGADCVRDPASSFCVHIVQVANRTAGSAAWQAPIEVARPGVGATPRAALDPAGNAALTWIHDIGRDRVLQATYRRGSTGSFPEPNDLSEVRLEIGDHEIALDSQGNALAIWSERALGSFEVYAAARSAASGVWGAPVRVSDVAGRSRSEVDVATTPSGGILATWVDESNIVRVASGDIATNQWEAPSAASGSGFLPKRSPQVATNSAGDVAVGWLAGDPRAVVPQMWAALRPRGGGWQAESQLAGAARTATEPDVVLYASGVVLTAWLSPAGASVAMRSPGGVWSRTVLGGPTDVSDPELAIDGRGNAVAVWAGERGVVRTALRPAGGRWLAWVDVSQPSATHVRLQPEGAANAIAVWMRTSGQRALIESADLVGRGPILTKPAVPRRARAVGERGAFAVESFAWSSPLAGAPRWRFGDGTSATGRRVVHAYGRPGRYVISVTQADTAGDTVTRRATIAVGAPRNTGRPAILGAVRFGSLLTCFPGTWTGARPITFAYQWLRDGFAIPGATDRRYRVRVRDLDRALGCRVRGTNALGSAGALARPVQVYVGAG